MKLVDIVTNGRVDVKAEIWNADALELLNSVRDAGGAELVFADPPFNFGRAYDVANDSMDDDEFSTHLNSWILAGCDALKSTGSLWLNLPDRWAANAVVWARDDFDMHLEGWCIWHYRFGVCQPNRFISSKAHALWFSKGKPKVNRDAALVPSDRATIYDDDRVNDSERGGMRMDLDVWGFDRYWGRVQGNNKERRSLHDNQLPELYLKRIIEVCSDPGDVVVDPFGGSGTTGTVALALGRNAITGDISPAYCKSIVARIKEGPVRL